jgi:hypothetical protein
VQTVFTTLSKGWNAEPNAPQPVVRVEGTSLFLSFELNAFMFQEFKEGDWAEVAFSCCSRYRLGPTNDEGWYRGQCRFSKIAPAWGEFYEVAGDLLLENNGLDWHVVCIDPQPDSKHFLFYFRDETFECDAHAWSIAFHTSSCRPSFSRL